MSLIELVAKMNMHADAARSKGIRMAISEQPALYLNAVVDTRLSSHFCPPFFSFSLLSFRLFFSFFFLTRATTEVDGLRLLSFRKSTELSDVARGGRDRRVTRETG